MRWLSIFYVLMLGFSQPAAAQSANPAADENCAKGLETMANLIELVVKPAASVENHSGQCSAKNVIFVDRRGHMETAVKYVAWNADGSDDLQAGRMARSMVLTVTGAKVLRASSGDPLWAYLKHATDQGEGRARLLWAYEGEDRSLDLRLAEVAFFDETKVSVAARFDGVNDSLVTNPMASVGGLILNDLSLLVKKGAVIRSPIEVAAGFIRRNNPRLNDAQLKAKGMDYIDQKLGRVLDGGSAQNLKALIYDMPYVNRNVSLSVNAFDGFLLLRLAGLALKSPPETVLQGVDIRFGYGQNVSLLGD